jgi:hypothetical protein
MTPAVLRERFMPFKLQPSRRTILAPPPSPASGKPIRNRVESVVLGPDEEVEWFWAHTPEGVSYVNGYSIVKKETDGEA